MTFDNELKSSKLTPSSNVPTPIKPRLYFLFPSRITIIRQNPPAGLEEELRFVDKRSIAGMFHHHLHLSYTNRLHLNFRKSTYLDLDLNARLKSCFVNNGAY